MYDCIVVGGGPAGLTAALYLLRNGNSAVVIEKSVFGGQITNSPKVENIPGFASISGDEFADNYLDQVMGQGGDVIMEEVVGLKNDGETITALLANGEKVEGRTAIIATGTKHRVFGFPEEEELIGSGIHFCAVCDGDFYKDKTVVMIGGGNSAFVEGIHLAGIVKKLIILQDLPFFTAEQKTKDLLLAQPNVEAHVNTKVLGYEVNDGQLSGVRYTEADAEGNHGEEKIAKCDGVFLAIGLIPDNEAFKEFADLNQWGYFESDESCTTKTPNIFVAGDCRSKTLRQVSTACGDGAIAGIAAGNYLRR